MSTSAISTNGHISSEEVARIIREWGVAREWAKEKLLGADGTITRSFQQRELEEILFIVQQSFPLSVSNRECRECREIGNKLYYAKKGKGSSPSEEEMLHWDTCTVSMLWNLPEFARIISSRARSLGIKTDVMMKRAFLPLINKNTGARKVVLEGFFGRGFVEAHIGKNAWASKPIKKARETAETADRDRER